MCRFGGSQLPSSYLILHKLINSSPRASNIDLLDLGKSQSTIACEIWALKSFYTFLVYLSLDIRVQKSQVLTSDLPRSSLPSWWLSTKDPSANAGAASSVTGSGRSPGGGNGSPLPCSCLGNPMDGGAWQAVVHGVNKESDMT